jgi:hypothetical protein
VVTVPYGTGATRRQIVQAAETVFFFWGDAQGGFPRYVTERALNHTRSH